MNFRGMMKKGYAVLILAVAAVLSGCAETSVGIEQIKLWQDFIVDIITAIFSAPVAAILLGVILREPLSNRIYAIKHFKGKFPGVEVEFDLRLEKIERSLNKVEVELTKPLLNKEKEKSPGIQDYKQRKTAIITAYAEIETAVRKKYVEITKITDITECWLPARVILPELLEKGKIDTETLIIADSMGSLRDDIIQTDMDKLSENQIETYKQTAKRITEIINNIKA
jgi:hypothetical protein